MKFLVIALISHSWSSAFHYQKPANGGLKIQGRRQDLFRLKSTKTSVLGGVSEFENWFNSIQGADCSTCVSHDDFGDLRGLAYRKEPVQEEILMNIPKSIVLQSDFSQPDWDAKLASSLWQECLKGSSGSISGYTKLLTKDWTPNDLPVIPPSTAPNALRHWSDEQKKLLAESATGQNLLDLQKKQDQIWRDKFSKVNGLTWEQFEWAMEVVHSRAFCGDFGIGGAGLPPTLTAAAPILAAAAGYFYYVQLHGQNDAILLALGLVAAAPAISNLLAQSPPAAVLLPLIDSANHLEEADSSIEYSPLSNSFTLTAGKNCIVEENGNRQLYISYGKKKDTELLLNYGFLRGVKSDGDTDNTRKTLAETFVSKRN